MRTRAFLLSFVLCWVFASAAATPAIASEKGCLSGIRATFRPFTESVRKIGEAIKEWRHRKGRAQAMEIQELLGEKWKEAQAEYRRANGGKEPENPQSVFEEFVKKWEDEVTDRMTDKTSKRYPKLAELLALMAAKSPTFEMTLMEYLWNHGTVKYKVLSHFNELIKAADKDTLGGKVGFSDGKVTFGTRFLELWNSKIKLPRRQTWTPDEFALFMTEMTNAMFRTMNPEPGFKIAWIESFGRLKISTEGWKLWRAFAEKLQTEYRGRHKKMLEGVVKEAFGEPRPEVVRSFYRWGMIDTVYRHLSAIKMLFTKEGTKIIEWKTGLKVEELDALLDFPLSKYLPRAVKDALIAAKSPEVFREILFNAEVERLSLEVMWFTRPIVAGLFLYYTMLEPAYGFYQTNEKRKEFEAEVKKNPDKYVNPASKRQEDDRINNLEGQIEQLSITKREIEQELESNPSLSEEEKRLRTTSLARINRKIGKLQELKIDMQKGIDSVHP